MTRLQSAVDMICKVRSYTENLLDNTSPDDWFRRPGEGLTHIAWQVGHLAVVEYFLTLKRVRGPRPEDEGLVENRYFELFGKGSTPQEADASPSPDEIRMTLRRVHDQALAELADLAESELDVPVEPAHPMFSTRLEAIQFCPCHEMLHNGEIALLRRIFGYAALR
jgi:hypothetical protein